MNPKPPIHWLRSFEAAARHLSFTQAAQELNISQAAISKQIKALESQLNSDLFKREAHGVSLTEQGRRYWLDTRDLITQLDNVTMQLFTQRKSSLLRLRCNISYSVLVLSQRLAMFRQQHPNLNIELTHNVWNATARSRNVDLEISYHAIGAHQPYSQLLHRDVLFPVVSASLSDDELADLPLISVLGYYQEWAWWLEQNQALTLSSLVSPWLIQQQNARNRPHNYWRVDNSLSAYQLAAQGLGIALGRSCLVEPMLQSGQLRRLEGCSELAASEGFHIMLTELGQVHEPSQQLLAFLLHDSLS